MFLSYKALEQAGVDVRPAKDGVELIPSHRWTDAAIEYFNHLTEELHISPRDADEVSDLICDLSLASVIRECLTPHKPESRKKIRSGTPI